MTMVLNTESVVVSRLRVHGGARDSMLARLRVSAMLGSASLAPTDMPAAAILIVNKFKDPLPGKMMSHGASMRLSREWEQAVRSQMSSFARGASRPIRGEVLGADAAVLFADEAELAVCLVRDWLQGRVPHRWWWRSVLGGLSPPQWLRQHVLARGEVMVPAMAALAARSLAVAWLARLEDTEAEEAMLAIERTHALALTTTQTHSPASLPRGGGDHPGLAGIADGGPHAHARSVAFKRLIELVTEASAPNLRPPQRRLLALSLALSRAPSWARTRALAIALQVLASANRYEFAHGLPFPDAGQTGARRRRVADTADGHGMPLVGESGKPQNRLPSTLVAGTTPPHPHQETRLRGAAQASLASPEPLSATPNAQTMLAPALSARATEVQEETTPAPEAMRVHAEDTHVIEDSARVLTEFGGIFYLLNAALALGWYSDFTAPRGRNIALSPWDWLALVGRAWFPRKFVRDPVGDLLAELAGRQGRALPRPRWFRAQLVTLRERLALALVNTKDGDIPVLVCRHHAEVSATASRVDVHLGLAELPLALRLAGVDRDIGWIPAAGRAVYFHFA